MLWMLGERSRALVGKGFEQAAVYVLRNDPPPPQQQQQQQEGEEESDNEAGDGAAGADGAAAAAADGAGGANAAGAAAAAVAAAVAAANVLASQRYRQLQLLGDPIVITECAPEVLGTITVRISGRGILVPVSIAMPPKDPRTGRPMPLAYICRYNSTWVEVAAALVSLGPAFGGSLDEGVQPGSGNGSSAGAAAAAAAAGGAAGQGVRLYLSAYNQKSGRIEFLEDCVMDLFRFW
jgi:hypothetical protein